MNDNVPGADEDSIFDRMADIIVALLREMPAPADAATVLSDVVARTMMNTTGVTDETTAREFVDQFGRSIMALWGAYNGIDIPLDGAPPPFPN